MIIDRFRATLVTVQTGLITSAAAITNAFLCAFAPVSRSLLRS